MPSQWAKPAAVLGSVIFLFGLTFGPAGCKSAKDEEPAKQPQTEASGSREIPAPHAEEPYKPPAGSRFQKRRGGGSERELETQPLSPDLRTLGYLSGSQEREAPAITIFHRDKVDNPSALSLYTSGHGEEAFLINMEGQVLHSWKFPQSKVKGQKFWRRAKLLGNGDLVVVIENPGILFRLDRDSRLVWSQYNGAHHALLPMADETFMILTRASVDYAPISTPFIESRKSLPAEPDGEAQGKVPQFMDDRITIVRATDGEVVKNVSIAAMFESSKFADVWRQHVDRMAELCTPAWRGERDLAGRLSGTTLKPNQVLCFAGDWVHSNDIHLLDGTHQALVPAFEKGNVLISIRRMNALVVADLDAETIVWHHEADFRQQHDANVLRNGNILLFDNIGLAKDRSRALELNPVTGETVWSYSGADKNPLFSPTCGTARRLANGNTLITETDNGRAQEVTREGEIVWEFNNPNRAGPDNEYIGSLFQLERIEESLLGWLNR